MNILWHARTARDNNISICIRKILRPDTTMQKHCDFQMKGNFNELIYVCLYKFTLAIISVQNQYHKHFF